MRSLARTIIYQALVFFHEDDNDDNDHDADCSICYR